MVFKSSKMNQVSIQFKSGDSITNGFFCTRNYGFDCVPNLLQDYLYILRISGNVLIYSLQVKLLNFPWVNLLRNTENNMRVFRGGLIHY